ncbi:MAG: hypothetical protein CL946_09755 [Ectothiorhodospiraceae bacterium]|nr:hypothetical protein [Ectothiorhodospiraceae bacterium]
MKHSQTILAAGLAAVILTVSLHAQEDGYILNQPGYVKIMPMYQSWNIDWVNSTDMTLSSADVEFHYPVSEQLSATLRTAPLSTGGNFAESNGMTDTQIGLTYTFPKQHLLAVLGLNIPTGQTELPIDDFLTNLSLSNRIFEFNSPVMGQGFNVHPGLIWALPLSKSLVLGVGATYQYKGAYIPLDNGGEYDPGDEILGTVGLDYRLSETSVVSADVVYVHYGEDTYWGERVFEYGDRVSVNAQFRTSFGYNVLWLYARYRTKEESTIWPGTYVVQLADRVEPDNVNFTASYSMRFSPMFTLGVLGQVRMFEETTATISGVTLFGAGLNPEITIGRLLSIPILVKYEFGEEKEGYSISGLHAGAGVQYYLR